jgi:hypothetical protein
MLLLQRGCLKTVINGYVYTTGEYSHSEILSSMNSYDGACLWSTVAFKLEHVIQGSSKEDGLIFNEDIG